MDRLVYVAMSGAKQILNAEAANNANLANASTVGFRADLSAFQTEQVQGAGLPSRAYATDASVGWDSSSGTLQTTGRPLDVAIRGQGWIAVQASDGTEAYTRAGDLRVDPSGLLTTALGNPVLGDSGPITVPPHSSIAIGRDGSVSIVPQGQPPMTISIVGRIKLVNPPASQLERGSDGLFRSSASSGSGASSGSTSSTASSGSGGSSAAVPADASVQLVPGALESSNVNIAETMVNMIELARSYEVQVKAMKAAEDNSASSSKLLQSS